MLHNKKIIILGIESSCDDTSASVIENGIIRSNVISSQKVHEAYGGVVPELASRAHQQNIVPTVDLAIKQSGVSREEIDAIAFTRGPGLLGSLLVGTSFAKGFSLALDIPMIDVNHLQGHVLAHYIKKDENDLDKPKFPHLCLLVSGGNSQIIIVRDYLDMEIIGKTIDDAAGEAFDKCGKVMGLPYPAGPIIDRLAKEGDPESVPLSKPKISGLDYSFSGLKTSFLYHIRDELKMNPNYIEDNKTNLCASLQKNIIDILIGKLVRAAKETGINEVTVAGGVSANSGLRNELMVQANKRKWKLFLPELRFTTDNAAMIAITGYYKLLAGDYADHSMTPFARMVIDE